MLNLIWILAAIFVIVATLILLLHSLRAIIQVAKREITLKEGTTVVAGPALLLLLAILFFLQINSVVIVSETDPYLMRFVDGAIRTIFSGEGLPMLKP